MRRIREGDIRPPSAVREDFPKMLEELILRALSDDPTARFQTGVDFAAALQGFAQVEGLDTARMLSKGTFMLFLRRTSHPDGMNSLSLRAPSHRADLHGRQRTLFQRPASSRRWMMKSQPASAPCSTQIPSVERP